MRLKDRSAQSHPSRDSLTVRDKDYSALGCTCQACPGRKRVLLRAISDGAVGDALSIGPASLRERRCSKLRPMASSHESTSCLSIGCDGLAEWRFCWCSPCRQRGPGAATTRQARAPADLAQERPDRGSASSRGWSWYAACVPGMVGVTSTPSCWPSRSVISVENGRPSSLMSRRTGANSAASACSLARVQSARSKLDLLERTCRRWRAGAHEAPAITAAPVVVGHVAPEALHGSRQPTGRHCLLNHRPRRGSNGVEVVDQGIQARLVQNRRAHRSRITNHQTQRIDTAAARAEHRRRPGTVSSASNRAAASSACSSGEVVSQPSGVALRPLPRRS